jgi:hypothetical protein
VEAEGFQIVVAAILPTTRRIKVHSRLMSALFELAFGDNVRCQLGSFSRRAWETRRNCQPVFQNVRSNSDKDVRPVYIANQTTIDMC